MGKRKRSSDGTSSSTVDRPNDTGAPSSSDNMPCSSTTDLLSREKSSHLSEFKPLSPRMDVSNSNLKLSNVHSSLAHPHDNLGHGTFSKRSRYYYGHQYSRRNSGNHTNASTSRGKTASSSDGRLSFKLTVQSGSDHGCQTENRERLFGRPERIRFSSCLIGAVSSDPVKMLCGICQKLLRRKPYFLGGALSSSECSVAAVLVCGHVYHADCLEQRTNLEDSCDPHCPLCSGLLSSADTSRGEK